MPCPTYQWLQTSRALNEGLLPPGLEWVSLPGVSCAAALLASNPLPEGHGLSPALTLAMVLRRETTEARTPRERLSLGTHLNFHLEWD